MASWITLDVTDGVAVVTLARPPVNAMSRAFMAELAAALDRVEQDGAVRAAVIASGLPGMFSGGADIRELEGLDARGCADFIALGHGVFGRLGHVPKPIVAAVNGTCVGGGLELALACDLRLAARSARFGQPEARLGVVSGWGGTQRLPRLVGKSRGLEMLMLGEPIGAGEALAAGLVSRVVDDERLLDEARALGRRLASQAPIALAKIKECVERGLGRPLDEGLAEEARCYVEAYLTDDAREGIRAFLEKRPARFQGR
ncbi:MAG: enoyl-CoA hydratase/isomerase family protein [Candidatus Rokubacteria bacterium]|nr:enoyl-CoA hydratase/isomerase family protein [Candidatus Rokubacteria bacterium]